MGLNTRGLGVGGLTLTLRPQCASQALKWTPGGSLAPRGELSSSGWAEREDGLWRGAPALSGGEQAWLSPGFPAELHAERGLHCDLAPAAEHHAGLLAARLRLRVHLHCHAQPAAPVQHCLGEASAAWGLVCSRACPQSPGLDPSCDLRWVPLPPRALLSSSVECGCQIGGK